MRMYRVSDEVSAIIYNIITIIQINNYYTCLFKYNSKLTIKYISKIELLNDFGFINNYSVNKLKKLV